MYNDNIYIYICIYMNNSVKQVKFLKQLAIYLDNKLDFHEYLENKTIFLLRKLQNFYQEHLHFK